MVTDANDNPQTSRREEALKEWYGTEEERLMEARLLVIVSMLKEFPELKAKVKKWLKENPKINFLSFAPHVPEKPKLTPF